MIPGLPWTCRIYYNNPAVGYNTLLELSGNPSKYKVSFRKIAVVDGPRKLRKKQEIS